MKKLLYSFLYIALIFGGLIGCTDKNDNNENLEITIGGEIYKNIKTIDYESLPNYRTFYINTELATPNIDNIYINGNELAIFIENITVFDVLNDNRSSEGDYYGDCKIHYTGYHGFPYMANDELNISEEQFSAFSKKYFTANSYNVNCVFHYNFINFLRECNISYDLLIKELIKMQEYKHLEELELDKIDEDEINLASKHPGAVYKKGGVYYTYDWLMAHSSKEYYKHELPIEQLRQILESEYMLRLENFILNYGEKSDLIHDNYSAFKQKIEDYNNLLEKAN